MEAARRALAAAAAATADFMRPCLAKVNKQHGKKASAALQGPSSTVTHSWALQRKLPVCQFPCMCHNTGTVGGWRRLTCGWCYRL